MIMGKDGSVVVRGFRFVRASRVSISDGLVRRIRRLSTSDGEPLFAIPGGAHVRVSALDRVAADMEAYLRARR